MSDSFDSPDGRTYSGPVSGATPGQAAPVADVNALARRIQEAWDAAFSRPTDTALDYRMAVLAVETTQAAIAAQDARPAPELARTREEAGAIRRKLDIASGALIRLTAAAYQSETRVTASQALDSMDHVTATSAAAASEQLAPELAAALAALENVIESHERVMFAAGIDIRRGEPGAARRLLGEQLGGWDGMPPWNGTETGAQYLERTSGGDPS